MHLTQHQLPHVQLAASRIIFQPFLLKLKLVKSKISHENHTISCVDGACLDYFQENSALINQLK
jgi:hypothetical protein